MCVAVVRAGVVAQQVAVCPYQSLCLDREVVEVQSYLMMRVGVGVVPQRLVAREEGGILVAAAESVPAEQLLGTCSNSKN